MPNDAGKTVIVRTPTPGKGVHSGTPCLVVLYGPAIGTRYFIGPGEFLIGRDESAAIVIDQESISRSHAQLVNEDDRIRIVDLGSTNGTWVNDRRVKMHDLEDGDLVRLGQTIFKFLSGTNIEARYHSEIYRLMTIDGLTGVANKRHFLEVLDRELSRARRHGRDLSLAMIDIDHFKAINDEHGHVAGDHLLRTLAGLVESNLRLEDLLARYGGEEFAILLPEVPAAGALRVGEKVRGLVEEHEFRYVDDVIPVTVSVGVTTVSGDDARRLTGEAVIADADARLYEAKAAGRNRVCG